MIYLKSVYFRPRHKVPFSCLRLQKIPLWLFYSSTFPYKMKNLGWVEGWWKVLSPLPVSKGVLPLLEQVLGTRRSRSLPSCPQVHLQALCRLLFCFWPLLKADSSPLPSWYEHLHSWGMDREWQLVGLWEELCSLAIHTCTPVAPCRVTKLSTKKRGWTGAAFSWASIALHGMSRSLSMLNSQSHGLLGC